MRRLKVKPRAGVAAGTLQAYMNLWCGRRALYSRCTGLPR